MKRTLLAAALCAISATVAAQPADVPAPKCEPKPQRPGESLLSDPTVRRQLERDVKLYRECMMAYIDARKASIKAHESAGNAAVDEYNRTMQALNPPSDDGKGSKSGTGTSPGAGATEPRRGY